MNTLARTLAFTALLAGTGCFTPNYGSPGYGVRVMTYNIQYGGGGRNLPAIADVIRAAAPDIVALQEVDVHWSERSDFADQATALAGLLGMQVRFAPIYSIADSASTRPAREFGVALLSRYPIARFSNHPLTRLSTQDADAGPRPHPGLLEALVPVGGTSLRVFNTHLDYRADPAVRRQQVAEILELVGTSAGPIIVFGDLNAGPDAEELQPLLARFRDAWQRGEGEGLTMSSTAPRSRIDYVLVSDDIRVQKAWVPASTASDHRPVVADLLLPVSTP